MEKMKFVPTHYGWLGPLPIVLRDEGFGWAMAPRKWLPFWTLKVVSEFYTAIGSMMIFFNPDADPVYPVRITGAY